MAKSRYILHADMDAFYASVEQLDNPAFAGLPLVVGGSAKERGVVAAASYEARQHGIRSAMPMKTALRLYPKIIVVPPRFTRYKDISAEVMSIFRRLTPLVEPMSLDEAYIDISKQVPHDLVDQVAIGLKRTVRENTGLAITVGGGRSKTVAKIASQVAKPDGLLLIKPGQEKSFLGPLDINLLWGVGPKTAQLLLSEGIKTISDLANQESSWAYAVLGKRGMEMRARAAGEDNSPVEPYRQTKSISSEATLPKNVGDYSTLERKLEVLSNEVALRLQKNNLKGKTVTIKLRLADFKTFTRQKTHPIPTDDQLIIFRSARELLQRESVDGLEFRLIGLTVSGFYGNEQLQLFPNE